MARTAVARGAGADGSDGDDGGTGDLPTPGRTDGTDGGDPWAAVRDLPPSAKLVATVLAHEGPLTQSELATTTMLPARTVRYAVGRLDEVDAVSARVSLTDARRRLYELTL
jgi:hypothetical protein